MGLGAGAGQCRNQVMDGEGVPKKAVPICCRCTMHSGNIELSYMLIGYEFVESGQNRKALPWPLLLSARTAG